MPGAGKYRFAQFIFRHRPEKPRLYTNVFGERGQRFSGFRGEIVEQDNVNLVRRENRLPSRKTAA